MGQQTIEADEDGIVAFLVVGVVEKSSSKVPCAYNVDLNRSPEVSEIKIDDLVVAFEIACTVGDDVDGEVGVQERGYGGGVANVAGLNCHFCGGVLGIDGLLDLT